MTKQIKHKIKCLGLSQNEVAKRVGISRIGLNRFLNGARGINSKTFIKLIEVIGGRIEITPTVGLQQ